MDWKKLAKTAVKQYEERGGAPAAKEDARELKNIASGEGTLGEKLKAATEALKDPGPPGTEDAPVAAPTPPAPSPSGSDAPHAPAPGGRT